MQTLGVTPEYPPKKGTLSSDLLGRYGVEEDAQHKDRSSGRQPLRFTVAALRSIFRVHQLPALLPHILLCSSSICC